MDYMSTYRKENWEKDSSSLAHGISFPVIQPKTKSTNKENIKFL